LTASLLLSWREGVEIDADDVERRVRGPRGVIRLRRLAPALLTALDQLVPCGAEEDRLAEQILEIAGTGALAQWYYTLQKLARRGLLCRTVQMDGRRLVTLLPISPAFVLTPSAYVDGRYLLSRFAYLRREDAAMVLESPLAHSRIILEDDLALAVVGALAKPATARELSERINGLPSEAVGFLLSLFAGAGMIQKVGNDGNERESPALSSWEFHDLLFHTRSRKGRSDASFGATYRMAGRLKPPPAVKQPNSSESCELYRPDLEQSRKDDPPLAEVMERRRSLREYDDKPLTVRQLSEFLYRVARVKDSREVELETPSGPLRMEFVSRPYPSGGALYELEFYVAVRACEGLSPGLYHYDGQQHRLVRLREQTAEVEQLLADAAASADIPAERVQVLIILAARFQRLAWKYASIAYALILKHVGVVYQTMYLTATAMDLAPCALGGGDADLFARAAGTDYYEETSVGEFLLGSKKSRMNKPAASHHSFPHEMGEQEHHRLIDVS
jgi:SagB-type dehydrogenase family enzyme